MVGLFSHLKIMLNNRHYLELLHTKLLNFKPCLFKVDIHLCLVFQDSIELSALLKQFFQLQTADVNSFSLVSSLIEKSTFDGHIIDIFLLCPVNLKIIFEQL